MKRYRIYNDNRSVILTMLVDDTHPKFEVDVRCSSDEMDGLPKKGASWEDKHNAFVYLVGWTACYLQAEDGLDLDAPNLSDLILAGVTLDDNYPLDWAKITGVEMIGEVDMEHAHEWYYTIDDDDEVAAIWA